MKRIVTIILIAGFLLCPQVYALDTTLFDIRNEIFEESKQIKSSLSDTRDTVLLNSLWDSCIMSVNQLDAYIYMLRIFNTIRDKDVKKEAIDSLSSWLTEIKNTNNLTVVGLGNISKTIDARTRIYVEKIKTIFVKLNKQVDIELNKIATLKKSLGI